MPCTDGICGRGRSDDDRIAEATLCGVLRVIEGATGDVANYFNRVDWAEVGVSRSSAERWWDSHKRKDELRRQRDVAAADRERTRRAALEKLTPAERAALGVA